MEITISKTSKNEFTDFENKAWASVDQEHWGREIEWVVEDFYFKATNESNEILGIIFGKYESGVTYVDNLLVGEEIRGQGVGKQLMGYIENWTKEKGGHKVFLLTREHWKASEFYKKLGYEVEGKLEKHFLGEDFVIFRKFL